MIPIGLFVWLVFNSWELKTISYDKIPKVGLTFDEYAFAWMGKSFLQSGLPMSWTTNLDLYKQSCKTAASGFSGFGLVIDGVKPDWKNITSIRKPAVLVTEIDYGLGMRHVGIVQPYLDHPPLAGVIYSLGIGNFNQPEKVTAENFRYVNRYVSLTSAILIFVLGWQLFNPWIGLIAAGLYSTTPATIFASRLTLAENVLVPIMLLTLILVNKATGSKSVRWWILAGLMGGIGMWIKFSAISILLAGMYLGWEKKTEFKRWGILGLVGLFIFGLYLGYGTFIGGNLFWKVLLAQSERAGWGIINLYQGLGRLFFNGFPIDGWWIGGFGVTLYMSVKQHKNLRPVTVMTMCYILTAILFGGDNNAWYLFPLGVLWCLAYAALVYDLYTDPGIMNSSLLYVFGLLASAYWGFFKLRPELDVSWVTRAMAVGFIGAAVIAGRWGKTQGWIKWFWRVGLSLGLYRMYIWNFRGIQYILENWEKLPYPLMWRG